MAEINVTPMVDVMLVLLIIFMVAAPLLDGRRAARPAADPGEDPRQDKEPLHAVGRPQRQGLPRDNTEIKMNELVAKLTAITEARGGMDERIFVRGDKKVDYGTVMRVMGRLSGGRLQARGAGD